MIDYLVRAGWAGDFKEIMSYTCLNNAVMIINPCASCVDASPLDLDSHPILIVRRGVYSERVAPGSSAAVYHTFLQ